MIEGSATLTFSDKLDGIGALDQYGARLVSLLSRPRPDSNLARNLLCSNDSIAITMIEDLNE